MIYCVNQPLPPLIIVWEIGRHLTMYSRYMARAGRGCETRHLAFLRSIILKLVLELCNIFSQDIHYWGNSET